MTASVYSLAIIALLSSIGATPICSYSESDIKKVVCRAGNYTEFILEKGIVSDNNITTSITLSDCRISDVNFESFQKLPSLRHLDLSKNKITRLKLGVLDGFRGLTHLNLSYNYLTTFPLGLFDQKTNLVNLDISLNRIDALELGVFDPLTNLEYLDLSRNILVGLNIDPYIFDCSPKIKRLRFSKNNMNNAKDNLLHALTSLQTLELDECELEDIPAFVTRRDIKTLKNLNLSGNRIKEVKESTFTNISKLLTLDLSKNVIERCEEKAFRPLKSLKSIVLRNNNLNELPETLFQNLGALSNIDLSGNLIQYVPVNAFRGGKLKNLNLSNNKITYLQDNFCLELKNSGAMLMKFYFNDNPWQCSCLRDILNEVKKFEISYNSAKYDGSHPVCVVTVQDGCDRHSLQ